jgi:LDH2 family malate/lactate/ureidoglycolate dehydrogenase
MIGDHEPSFIGAEAPLRQTDNQGSIAGVLVVAFDPEFFGGVEEYRAMAMETAAAARRISATESVPALMHGELERRSRIRRAAEGIPIPKATWKDGEEIARRFHLQPPGR